MSGPIWLNGPFAALMIILALCHTGRLVTARRRGRTNGYDVDLTHLVICTAMAAMLVTTFGAHLATAWSIVIGVPTLWFILRALRTLPSGDARALMQPVQQLLMCAAMLFMLTAASRSSSAPRWMGTDGMARPGMAMDGHLSHDLVASISSTAVASLVLAGLLGLVAVGHTRQLRVAVASQLAWPLPGKWPIPSKLDSRQLVGGLLLAPGLSLGSQLAMSGTMIYMLVLMA